MAGYPTRIVFHGSEANRAARVKTCYLAYLNTAFDYYENLSRSLFHREIPQVFLIHGAS